jgi:F-type H+/Na+-transporting ATPase subunit alpha
MAAPEASVPAPLARQAQRVGDYRFALRLDELGAVISVGDGIAWLKGLPSAAIDDLLAFDDGSEGVVFSLTEPAVGVTLLHQSRRLRAGTSARRLGRSLSLPVGDGLLGRVIDPLGQPLDGLPPVDTRTRRPLDVLSPPILARDFVRAPLYTGIKIVDTLVPIGRGQRQLIVGESGVGRSAVALDAVLAQRGTDVLCVYVLIGQRRSAAVNVLELLRSRGAMDYTTVVVGEAGALPGLKFLAPFAGCAVAEHWMFAGRDTLVVFDDLSTHALAYRELSLLLRRPPGREAYPGDIFYLHARLLERATCLSKNQGGGSMTALPIVEIKQGDLAAYIPTNLISITDGQILLDADLFAAGFRPAVDIGRSVSRIGGKAQHPRMREESGRIKLDYLQFLELETFTRFGTRLEAGMEVKLQRGRILRELLKQDRLRPLAPPAQLAWLVAFNDGHFAGRDPKTAAAALDGIAAAVEAQGLTLDDPRERYLDCLAICLPPAGERQG